MDCEICSRIKNNDGVVYRDEKVAVLIPKEVFSEGHLQIVPLGHYPILESVPDDVLGTMFIIANKLGMVLFDIFKAQGTNILIQNGISAGQEDPHVILNLISRKEADGIDLQWNTKQVSEEEMSSFEAQIKANMEEIPSEKKKTGEDVSLDKDKKSLEEFKLKSLFRIP
jgi:diadenosine tetraphosphate (Ap4A) HIT family hydrolase